MPKIRPKPRPIDILRSLFLKAEQDILNEILRKNAQGYVDYAETAAMERVQATLQGLVDESWIYVPQVVEKPFVSNLSRQGYSNARELTSAQTIVVEQLIQNLMGEIIDSTNVAYNSARNLYQVARLDNDVYRQSALAFTVYTEALGKGAFYAGQSMEVAIRNHGITAFVDKRGRQWSLTDYCSMATRTTAHQAEVSAVLTKDDHDLYQIVKIGSTCPICAPLEGRVYSKSGMDPNYPPLSLAFGKIDPNGGDDLSNTYLCIHPNCLHSLIRYTEMGKTDAQIQKMRDFSNPETNPLDIDPRSKKQIEAYRTKERNRAKLRNDLKQYNEFREILGKDAPSTFEKFKNIKYNESKKWDYLQGLNGYIKKYPTSNKKYYDVGVKLKEKGINCGVPLPPVEHRAYILPEGTKDPYHIMKRMVERNITDDDLRSYIKNADCMFVQWGGRRRRYEGKKGAVILTRNGDDWIYKTAWKAADFGDESDQIKEVIKNVGL